MRSIAEVAGVSCMTVSLALRNHTTLPETTRKRIQTLAQELGYRPNPVMTALMKHVRARRRAPFTATLAYVTAFPTRDGWRQRALFRDFHQGVAARAEQLGYKLEEFWLKARGMTGRRLSQILWTRSIEGVIIAPLPHARGHLRLDWPRFAVVTIGYSLWQPVLHRAVNHQPHSMALALRQLKRLGYRRIGLALPVQFDARADNNWTGSFLVYQQRVAVADRIPLLVTADLTEAGFRKWLRAHKPDAVIAGDIAVRHWLDSSKVRVPEDVGFVHLELSENLSDTAGVGQNARLVGSAAVDLVVQQIEHGERGIPAHPKVVMIEGQWVSGPTVTNQREQHARRRAA